MPLRHLPLLAALAALVGLAAPTPAPADPVVPGEEHCVVNVRSDDVLNLRARPGAGSAILAGLRYGQCGVIVTDDCQGNWCPVEDGHDAGWVNRRYISMVSPAMYCVAGVEDWDVLNLRAWPSPGSRVLAELPPDQCGIAFLPYARDGWQKVRVDGWEGWVARRHVSGQQRPTPRLGPLGAAEARRRPAGTGAAGRRPAPPWVFPRFPPVRREINQGAALTGRSA